MAEEVIQEGRSLAETPTYSVASVVTFMVFVCFVVERSIYRFGKWLKKTRRKALYASLEKMKEGLIGDSGFCAGEAGSGGLGGEVGGAETVRGGGVEVAMVVVGGGVELKKKIQWSGIF